MKLELRQSAHVVQLGIMGPDVIDHGLRRNDDDVYYLKPHTTSPCSGHAKYSERCTGQTEYKWGKGVIYPPLESILMDISVLQRLLSDISGYCWWLLVIVGQY